MYCEFCGTSMDEGALVCGVCGNQRQESATLRREPAPAAVAETVELVAGPPCPKHAGMPLVGQCPRCGKQVCVRCAPDAALDNFTCTDCKGLTVAHQVAPSGASCAVHPGVTAAFICGRCGSFACNACRAVSLGSEGLCVRCGESPGQVLASRGSRFGANFIDTLVVMVPMIVSMFAVPLFSATTHRSSHGGDAELLGLLVFPAMFAGLLLGAGVQVAAQVHWGQSLGKRAFGIRVVRMSGQPIELWRLILLRNVVIHVVAQLCGLIGLVDAVMIFGAEQRCLHDYFADSKVVIASSGS